MPKCVCARANDLFFRLFCAVFDRAEFFCGEGDGAERSACTKRDRTSFGRGDVAQVPTNRTQFQSEMICRRKRK